MVDYLEGDHVSRPTVFISWTRQSTIGLGDFTPRDLADELERRSLGVWLDEYEIGPLESIPDKVYGGLQNSVLTIVWYASGYSCRAACREEFTMAVARRSAERRVGIDYPSIVVMGAAIDAYSWQRAIDGVEFIDLPKQGMLRTVDRILELADRASLWRRRFASLSLDEPLPIRHTKPSTELVTGRLPELASMFCALIDGDGTDLGGGR